MLLGSIAKSDGILGLTKFFICFAFFHPSHAIPIAFNIGSHSTTIIITNRHPKSTIILFIILAHRTVLRNHPYWDIWIGLLWDAIMYWIGPNRNAASHLYSSSRPIFIFVPPLYVIRSIQDQRCPTPSCEPSLRHRHLH